MLGFAKALALVDSADSAPSVESEFLRPEEDSRPFWNMKRRSCQVGEMIGLAVDCSRMFGAGSVLEAEVGEFWLDVEDWEFVRGLGL